MNLKDNSLILPLKKPGIQPKNNSSVLAGSTGSQGSMTSLVSQEMPVGRVFSTIDVNESQMSRNLAVATTKNQF